MINTVKHKMKSVMLAVTAFTVGASVMAIEITASRVLAPHFGASLFVWTALIVTVLLSMSLGYWFGGKLTSRFADARVLGLFLCGASVLLMLGMWATGRISVSVPKLLTDFGGATAVLFAGSLLVSFLVFSLPVFLLAMAGPFILARWAEDGEDVGAVAGKYFAISTVGSVIGTVTPTLVFVPEFGVRATMISIAVVLGVLGMLFVRGVMRPIAVCVVALAISLVVVQGRSRPETVVYEHDSPYQLIRIEERGGIRYLTFNEASGVQSVYRPDGGRTRYYYDHFAAIPFLGGSETPHSKAAVLGLAGGTLVRQYVSALPDGTVMDIVGVEIDGAVVDAARQYFALDELPLKIVERDGREFLTSGDEQYDNIIIDAYSTQLYIPSHMASREFFSSVRDRLSDRGFAAMNINAPHADSRLLTVMTNTVASVFPHVYVLKAGSSWNWLVIAGNTAPDFTAVAGSLPEDYADVAEAFLAARRVAYDGDTGVFTDDWAPIEHMTDGMISEAMVEMVGDQDRS
ncbi:MAG: fused MFS/spermidine synthase [Patescibacteria group bacterium]|nr:fused MFS/spermidine synthase [Patescibacteria group bacterium]